MQKYIMALDQGTTSSRCILFDKKGNICSMAQKEFTQIYPQAGWVEHNPREIWASQLAVAIEAMANIGADASQLACLGITNQRETTIVWDRETGEPGRVQGRALAGSGGACCDCRLESMWERNRSSAVLAAGGGIFSRVKQYIGSKKLSGMDVGRFLLAKSIRQSNAC